jgi:copper chaperone CopZ
MKKVFLSLFAVAALTLAAAPAQACGGNKSKGTTAKKAPKGAAMVVMAVGGMSCGGCAAKIVSELKSIDGVYVATVELKSKRATVKYAAKKVTVGKLLKTIRDLGYKVDIVKRS